MFTAFWLACTDSEQKIFIERKLVWVQQCGVMVVWVCGPVSGRGLSCVTGGYWLEHCQGHGKVSCSVSVKGSSRYRNSGWRRCMSWRFRPSWLQHMVVEWKANGSLMIGILFIWLLRKCFFTAHPLYVANSVRYDVSIIIQQYNTEFVLLNLCKLVSWT